MAYAATRCCGLRNDTRAECISVCKASTDEEQRPLVSYFPENDLKTGAENECLAHGLRLCSRRELRDGVCCKTGCNSDSRFAWTADACPRKLCSKHCLASDNSTSVQGRLSTAAAAQLRATYAWLRREDGSSEGGTGQAAPVPRQALGGAQHKAAHACCVTPGLCFKPNTTLVLMGDSLSRYQYLDLVYTLQQGAKRPYEKWRRHNPLQERSWPSWAAFHNGTNAQLWPNEIVCDCDSEQRALPTATKERVNAIENRLYRRDDCGVRVAYVAAFASELVTLSLTPTAPPRHPPSATVTSRTHGFASSLW